MKYIILFTLPLIVVSFTATSCIKKQEVAQPQVNEAPATIEANDADITNRKPFKFTVTTNIEPKKGEDVVKILIAINDVNGKYPIKYDLDCESDGTYEFTGLTTPYQYCTYKKQSGNYTISVRGDIPGIILCDRVSDDCQAGVDRRMPQRDDSGGYFYGFYEDDDYYSGNICGEPVISINDWGDIQWKTMSSFAAECSLLGNLPFDSAPNLKDVTDMSNMFDGAAIFQQEIGDWDVSHVTNMKEMFAHTDSFSQPLESWDVSHVTNMERMFAHSRFNEPLNQWNVSNVTNMHGMFHEAESFNQPLDKWDVSNVTDMSQMFMMTLEFNQPLDSWNVSNVKDMHQMFWFAQSFNQPLDSWNVSNVNNMNDMFYSAYSFSHYPQNWVVPEDGSENMFFGSGVKKIAENKPLKTEKRGE